MKFCSECGSRVALQDVPGDTRRRYVCAACGQTHYQNPNVLVAVYVCVGEEVLWIKRAIRPAIGRWAMPGGFMETEETPEAAAARELEEETGIKVSPRQMMLVSVSSILHMAQTHLVFRCHLEEKPAASATDEVSAFGWFDEREMPWAELAFPSIEPHVRQLYRWLAKRRFAIRVGFIDDGGSQYRVYPLADQPE